MNSKCVERLYENMNPLRARQQMLPDWATGRTPECLGTRGLGFMPAFLSWLDHSFIPAGLVTWPMSWWAPTSDYHRHANYPAQLWAISLVISQAVINRKKRGEPVSRAIVQVKNALLGFETAQLWRVFCSKIHLFSGWVISYSHMSQINQAYANLFFPLIYNWQKYKSHSSW